MDDRKLESLKEWLEIAEANPFWITSSLQLL